MPRRISFFLLFVLVISVVVRPAAAQEAADADHPNILWISAEDMSARVGAYGDEVARTPHIDRLAEEGMRFTNAFTAAGVCAPNRSALITGMYQNSIGTHHMRTRTHDTPGLPPSYEAVPPPYVKAFTEYLRAAGYYTTNNAKTDYQFGTPFTAWDESSGEAHWRNRPDKSQPFFSVFNFTSTHESRAWADHPSNEGAELQTDPAEVEVPPYYPDTPAVRRHLARQYDNIAQMDEQVGQILRQLEEDGLAEETIVFFWTDHGDGLPRAKRWLYDSGIHVPLIVRWPGQVEGGSTSDELVSFVDLAPTVLAMAGVQKPVHMQGQAFMGEDAPAAPRDYVFAARDRFDESYDMVRAARDERFKYIRNYYPNKPYVLHVPYRNRSATMQELLRLKAQDGLDGPASLWMRDSRPPEELYDTEADPHEVSNLAQDPEYQDVLKRMRTAMDEWMERVDDMGDVSEDAMVRQMRGGEGQPKTAKPIILPRRSTDTPTRERFTFSGPTEVIIYDGTHGASIGYTTEEGEDARWKLYSGPIEVTEETTIRAKAIRYGYEESEEAKTTFEAE